MIGVSLQTLTEGFMGSWVHIDPDPLLLRAQGKRRESEIGKCESGGKGGEKDGVGSLGTK